MAPSGEAYKVDWVFSNTSNDYVAKDRAWFTTSTKFESQVIDGSKILGVGNVELEVKTNIHRSGSKTHRTIVLKDVMFVPTAICNILGAPIFKEFKVVTNISGGYLEDLKTHTKAAVFDMPLFWKLWLVGHRKGYTSLDRNTVYWINAQWDSRERERWFLYTKLNSESNLDDTQTPQAPTESLQKQTQSQVQNQPQLQHDLEQPEPDYTPAEKTWLKRAFGNEFKFLREYGLSIYKDADREEGRAIVRALIVQEALEDDEDDDEEEEEEDQFLADLEADPSSPFAHHYFSAEQLDWIQKHYRHSGNFLIIHGLKFYDDEDCKEGVAIAKAFMEDDEDS
jgi:hypothetical protein